MTNSKELIRQIKKFLNNEKQSYINTSSELVIALSGVLYLIVADETNTLFAHNVVLVKVNTLREFIDFYRNNK